MVTSKMIIPSTNGFLYQALFGSFSLGIRLYTKPASSCSGFALVNKLIGIYA